MFTVSVWSVSQKNQLFVWLHSFTLWGKCQSHRNNGINEKLCLLGACVVIFCRLHWSGFLLIQFRHQLSLSQGWTGVWEWLWTSWDGRPQGPAPRARWSRGVSWCSEGAPLPCHKSGCCLCSSLSHARYLSIRALKSVPYYFNGVSLKNNYFTVPINPVCIWHVTSNNL